MAKFMRKRGNKCHGIFELGLFKCNHHLVSFIFWMKVESRTTTTTPSPIRQYFAEFPGLIWKNLQVNSIALNFHVLADAQKHFLNCCFAFIVRIRKVRSVGKDHLCFEHPASSK